MADPLFSEILTMFDKYVLLIENQDISSNVNVDNVTKVFDLCLFIEAAIVKARETKKIKSLESHLIARWKQDNRNLFYKVDEFETACDRFLEIFLKDPNVSTPVIDKLLQLYTQQCGSERLNSLLTTLLTDSMCANTILESVVQLGISDSTIEDEAILATWINDAGHGKHNEVTSCINEMLADGHLLKIIEFVSKLDANDSLKKLIMKCLTTEASEYKPKFFATIVDLNRKQLWNLLQDSDFQLYFLDGIFYFGRNMERRDNSWQCAHEFTYQHLVRIMKILLNISDNLSETTNKRLNLAKLMPDGPIWYDVERDTLS